MNPIVYVDGRLADYLGRQWLQGLADQIATLVRRPVDVMTHGASQYHAEARISGAPHRSD